MTSYLEYDSELTWGSSFSREILIVIFHSSFDPLALSVTLTFSGFITNPSRLLQLARLVDVLLLTRNRFN